MYPRNKDIAFFIVLSHTGATVISINSHSGVLLATKRLPRRTNFFSHTSVSAVCDTVKMRGKYISLFASCPRGCVRDKSKVLPSNRRRGHVVALLASIPPARETDFLLQETVTLWRVDLQSSLEPVFSRTFRAFRG